MKHHLYMKYIKRILDIILSLVFLPFILPLILILSLIVFFEDFKTPFYISSRLGFQGKIFNMYKLRTMKVGSKDIRNLDGSTYNSLNDKRVTRVGKFLRKTSLDELPQIFNIIKGNMSFIGPRPDLPDHYKIYSEDQKRKLEVLPGISGYNQANFRNSINWEKRLENDVYYANNISFILDLKIFIKTIQIVILRKNIYIDSNRELYNSDNNKESTNEWWFLYCWFKMGYSIF